MGFNKQIRHEMRSWPAIAIALLLFPIAAFSSGDNSRVASIPSSPELTKLDSPPPSAATPLFVGLAENPPESAGASTEVMEAWFGKAVAAGISMQQITPSGMNSRIPKALTIFTNLILKPQWPRN